MCRITFAGTFLKKRLPVANSLVDYRYLSSFCAGFPRFFHRRQIFGVEHALHVQKDDELLITLADSPDVFDVSLYPEFRRRFNHLRFQLDNFFDRIYERTNYQSFGLMFFCDDFQITSKYGDIDKN